MGATVVRVDVNPELLRWVRERAGMDVDALTSRFPRYAEWESGDVRPTLKQLEALAKAARAPVGYFFLSEPLDEPIPIPDFRTVGSTPPGRPSPDLLDTVYLCQQRQDWYRDFARLQQEEPLAFVGSANPASGVEAVAADMRATLRLDLDERRDLSTWTEALRRFIEAADALGVLVMMSGIVGSNTRRVLDPGEFRGFALSDDLAPLVFVNGADTKAAQMFTLAHELAHLWLGESALSDSGADTLPVHRVEAWCNRVAAELLVPLATMREEYRPGENLYGELARLARRFKVSTLVVLRRIHDAGGLTRGELDRAWNRELERLKETVPSGGGGDFYPGRRPSGSANGSPAPSSAARSKAGRCSRKRSGFSVSERRARSTNSRGDWALSPDAIPSRRRRVHPREKTALRVRFLSGVLGLAGRGAYGRQGVQREKGGRRTACREATNFPNGPRKGATVSFCRPTRRPFRR